MDPKIALDLSKNRKVNIFMKYLLQEMEKFNSLDGLEDKDKESLAIEVKARELAFNKMKEVVQPILKASGTTITFNKNDYLVEVEQKK